MTLSKPWSIWGLARLVLAVTSLYAAIAWGFAASADDVGDWSSLSTPTFRSVGDVAGVSVSAIAQDGDGFLWAGSQGGLSRYDGYRFRSFLPDPQTPGALPDSWINVLHTDRSGHLWIGTMSGGLTRYDAASDSFVTYAAGPTGIGSNTVYALTEDDDGLWIGTSGGLEHRTRGAGAFVHYRHDLRRRGSLPNDSVRALLCDSQGTLWVGTDGGLARRDPGSSAFAAVPLPGRDGRKEAVWSIFEDSRHRLWFGTQHHGVVVIEPDRGPAHAFTPPKGGTAAALLQSESIHSIAEVRPGEMWFGTYAHGIFGFTTHMQRLSWLQHDPAIATTLPQNEVWSIFRDRSGSVWVGTGTGLRRTDAGQAAIVTLRAASSISAGISGSDVTSLYAAPHNEVWLGVGNQGIDLIDPVRGRFSRLRPSAAAASRSLPSARVRAIAGLPGGPVFIATDRGLYRADSHGGRVRRAAVPGGRRDDIEALTIADRKLWIVTAADGVWTLDLPIGDRAVVPRRQSMAGLSDSRVTAIAPASRGQLWIGTYSGLNRFDVASGRIEKAEHPGTRTRLMRDFISSFLTDRQGRLWVGTFGGGIELLDRREPDGHPHFLQLSVRQGLPSVNVDAMLLDRTGRVWVATDDGLALIDASTLAIRTLHQADGVELRSYYFGAADTLDNGDLVFGASGGATIVRPSRMHESTLAPPVVVTDVEAGGREVSAGATRPIIVPAGGNSLAVEFAALDFSAPEQNRYAYRLDGFDLGWIQTPASRRLAAYTNLPPGTYALQLHGSNRDGIWNAAPLIIPVQVLAAWYQTTAWKLVEAMAGFGILLLLVHVRTAYLRRREHQLERQVSERTAELQALAIELGKSQSRFMHLAYSDALTDLPNRRMFTEAFATMLATAERNRSETALLLIDLDHFKGINDRHGHDAGDALLIGAADRFRSAVRKSDCVARLGGDEFAIVLADDLNAEAIDGLCARIVQSFAAPIVFNGVALETSPSIGVAVFPKDGANGEELYKSADAALYAAKRGGRNTVRRFSLEPGPALRL